MHLFLVVLSGAKRALLHGLVADTLPDYTAPVNPGNNSESPEFTS